MSLITFWCDSHIKTQSSVVDFLNYIPCMKKVQSSGTLDSLAAGQLDPIGKKLI